MLPSLRTVVHKNSGIQRPAIVLWLRLFLRFAVEERILRGGADGDGVHLAASVEQIEALGGQAGGEHDTGVDTMVGGGGAGMDGFFYDYSNLMPGGGGGGGGGVSEFKK